MIMSLLYMSYNLIGQGQVIMVFMNGATHVLQRIFQRGAL